MTATTTANKNSYSFDHFLEQRDNLDDLQNPFLLNVFKKYANDEEWDLLFKKLQAFSKKNSGKWRSWIKEISRVENHPKLRHYDAHNHRIDRIVRPLEMHLLEKEVFSEGLFSSNVSTSERAMKRFLLHHNGEAGVACPIACTDGLVAILEYFQDSLSPELEKIFRHSKEGIDGEFAIGAQFMSEIQGGSNIPANVLEAVPDGKHYRLYGNKFFCSAAHADYSVVTARVQGTKHVALFIVPTWLEGDKEKERRNGHVLNRLKWKLGTCELPSAEIEYKGAIAYPVGPMEKGVSLAVGIVLTLSRLDIGFASGAFLMRAAREANIYARFREVFDRKIDEFPMAKAQLIDLTNTAKRTTATAFHIYYEYNRKNKSWEENFEIRELILLQKIFASRDTVNTLRTAISIFGGHGAIEDFSSIPRLYRDAMVNELWEGPKNVLLAQVYRDLLRNKEKYSPTTLLSNILSSYDTKTIQPLQDKLKELLNINLYAHPTDENIYAAAEWEKLWSDVFYLYQQQVLANVEDEDILCKEILSKFQ